MGKLNISTSIVDYLKSQGQDSSYDARKTLAKSMGIVNYSGTASQNTKLLSALQATTGDTQKKNQGTSAISNAATNAANNTLNPSNNNDTVQSLKGVDQSITDKANSSFTQSDKVTNADRNRQEGLSRVEELTSKDNIISNDVMNALNSSFTVPSAVLEADAYLSAQLEKIQSGKTSYSDQVKDMMDKIMNREKFSYDVDADPLFQQALASAMNSGKQAMQDTIGQASALTGGYGSSYATSAGNQAYNSFIEDAYNNLPEYYKMAMEAYQMEGDEMYRQFGMLSELDDKEYNRNVTAYDATYQHRNQIYNEAYTQYRDNKSDAFAMANLQLNEHGQKVSDAYNYYVASSDYADSLYEREYTSWRDEVNQAMEYAKMLNSDWWSQTNFDEGVRQYEKNYAQTEDHFVRNQEFQSSESQKNRDWQSSEAEKERAFTASENAKNRAVKGSSGGSGGTKIKSATENQMKNALEAYNTGGMDGLNKYLNSVPDDYDKDSIAQYVGEYGELPFEMRTYTKIKDTTNGGWGIDHNDIVQDEYGNKYRIDELPESLQQGLTDLKKGSKYKQVVKLK